MGAVGVNVVGEHINRRDVPDAHGRGVRKRVRRLVARKLRDRNDRDASRDGRLAVGHRVVKRLLGRQRLPRRDPQQRAVEKLHRVPRARRHRHALQAKNAPRRRDVVGEYGDRHGLVRPQVGRVRHGDGRKRRLGRLLDVNPNDPDALLYARTHRVFEVVRARGAGRDIELTLVEIERKRRFAVERHDIHEPKVVARGGKVVREGRRRDVGARERRRRVRYPHGG